MTLFLSYVAMHPIHAANKLILQIVDGLLTSQNVLIENCSKEQLYQVLSTLIVNIHELRQKDPSVPELRILYKSMLGRQLKDWKAKNVEA